MNFKSNLNQICKERGTTLTAICRELGISSSKVTAINKGSIPSEQMMLDFAKILNCSVMDFFKDEGESCVKKESHPYNRTSFLNDVDEDELDIIRIYRTLSRKNKHEFMTMVYNYEKN